MPQGPVRATHEFGLMRRASSLEVIPSQELPATKIDKKMKRHKRSSSLGTTEKLRRDWMREKKQAETAPMHGGLHNIRDALYRNSEQCYINPNLPVFGLSRTRSLDCLSELEYLTLDPSPQTPHEGHIAPLPQGTRSDTPIYCSTGRSHSQSQTPEETVSPFSYFPVDNRSPSFESPDKILGTSPRVNCSFLFARQPPPNAATARCTKGSSLESLESCGPDKSKIKIIFSNNSVFNRPDVPCVARHSSPAEQACQ